MERTVHGVETCLEAVTDKWLRELLAKLGKITNFEFPIKPYYFGEDNRDLEPQA